MSSSMPAGESTEERRAEQRIVLGTWGLSGPVEAADGPAGYPGRPPHCFDEVLDAAYRAGVRWIDTAPGYGAGAGLVRLAAWQRSRRAAFRVVMKPGRPHGPDGPRSDLRIASLRNEIDAGVELVGPPAAVLIKDPPEEAFLDGELTAVLSELASTLPDTRVGVATHRLDLVPYLPWVPNTASGNAGPTTKNGPPAHLDMDVANPVIQMEHHAVNRTVAVPAAAHARQLGWEVWGMQPLAYGFLAGRYGPDTRFAADDWRSRLPRQARSALAAGARGFAASLPPHFSSRSAAECALAWCFSDPSLQRLVVGPRTGAQFASVLRAMSLATDPRFTAYAAAGR
ncbi:aldo/keto reductase [Streptomyces sp. NPDC057746]|uniref:aldo/keto reductase n=1 Tax=Streptomyces sp. NPDC057746 TaxID=3346237 RepID=UPI0036B11897